MKIRRPATALLALVLAAAGTVAMPQAAMARTYVGVSIGVPPPPPPRVERVVVRPGYVWAPGYWRWNGARHVWVGGYWMPARAGYRYAPPHWVHTGPAWTFRAGYWHR